MKDILWINLWNKLQLYYSNQNNILDIYNINQELDLLLTKSNINEQTFGLNMLINMLNHDYHDNDIPIYNIQYTIYNIQYTIYNIQYTIYNIINLYIFIYNILYIKNTTYKKYITIQYIIYKKYNL
jgi:hypothetical protein